MRLSFDIMVKMHRGEISPAEAFAEQKRRDTGTNQQPAVIINKNKKSPCGQNKSEDLLWEQTKKAIEQNTNDTLKDLLSQHLKLIEDNSSLTLCAKRARRNMLIMYARQAGLIGEPSNMLLSIIINAFNEGPRLRETIKNLRNDCNSTKQPHEFIVVADGTTDDSLTNLGPDVLIVKNKTRVGCGKSKKLGASAAKGSVLLFCDAHQTVEQGHISDLVKYAESGVIACPALCNIEYDKDWNAHRSSSSIFIPNDNHLNKEEGHYTNWAAEKGNTFNTLSVSCVTCMTKTTYNKIGGWNGYAGTWGVQERGLALRAFFANIPIVTVATVVMGHEFRSSHWIYKAPSIFEVENNLWHAWHVVLGRNEFFTYVAPILRKRKHYRQKIELQIKKDKNLQQETEKFQKQCRKRRLDEKIKTFFNLVIQTDNTKQNEQVVIHTTIEDILQKFKTTRVLYSRWGDGEVLAMAGAKGANCDHVKYTLTLQDELKNAWNSNNGVIHAVSELGLQVDKTKYKNNILGVGPHFTWDWLPNANKQGNLKPLFDLLFTFDVIYVGPEFLRPVILTLWPTGRFISIPEACAFDYRQKILNDIVQEIKVKEPQLIGFSAGPTACILIEQLIKHTKAHLFDFGSIFDAYAGRVSRRVLWNVNADPVQLWEKNFNLKLPPTLKKNI